ncbi:MAG: DUF6492 family protein [Candidatus Dependentiae bacterium]
MKTGWLIVAIFIIFQIQHAQERVTYSFTLDPIDIVIPCHKKDSRTLELVVNGIKQHLDYRRIIIVSSEQLLEDATVEWFDEKEYPFDMYDIIYEIFFDEEKARDYIDRPKSRAGWIYQQFLKLYASYVIPDISNNILIVDADTIFFKPVVFQNGCGAPLFNVSDEVHPPYLVFMRQLIPGLKRAYPQFSGITHHMLFQRCVLDDLFATIEKNHNMEPWRAICQNVDKKALGHSCMSEYELYFNFLLNRSGQPKIRKLNWNNVPFRCFDQAKRGNLHYVSCHTYKG